ncbi:MAG TPA: XRE family transcriptional regulator, partial [Bacteroidaceae bacterium]|nr:XRE family transcriptional regulator [Bacteroidaceae bacterium]
MGSNTLAEKTLRTERGVAFPSLKTVDKIATAMGVALKDFFDFGDSEISDKAYEREISKINAFLRTLNKKEVSVAYK